MSTETIIGVASIAAIVAGPIIALELQKRLDKGREARDRKLTVFKTLMTYRATTLSPHFVQALNLINVEFNAKNEKPVMPVRRKDARVASRGFKSTTFSRTLGDTVSKKPGR